MRIGTRSLLFGAHQVLIHPWFVAAAWWRLYGTPRDPRLWLAFLLHDWGYWGKERMDDEEGERHVELGARIMAWLFDTSPLCGTVSVRYLIVRRGPHAPWLAGRWGQFCLFHSRFFAKRLGQPVSRLCVADKLAIALTPAWLYLPLARLSGELAEYQSAGADVQGKYLGRHAQPDAYEWYRGVQTYLRDWAETHKFEARS